MSDGYNAAPDSAGRFPNAQALAAGLLAASGGDFDICLFTLRQAVVLLESARDIRDLSKRREDEP